MTVAHGALGTVAAGALFVAVQTASAQAAQQPQSDDLRPTITQESIAGQYVFSGPYTCIQSSTGFNSDLTPMSPTPGGPSAFISVQHGITTGFRTFNADGTGTVEFYTQSVTGPGVFYGYFPTQTPPPPPGFPPGTFPDVPPFSFNLGVATNGGVPRPSGSAGAARTSGHFTWRLLDAQLLIDEANGTSGTIVEGTGAGQAITVRDLPPVVGIIGKDRRTISITHQRMQVETTETVLPNGSVRETARVCIRERLLRKL